MTNTNRPLISPDSGIIYTVDGVRLWLAGVRQGMPADWCTRAVKRQPGTTPIPSTPVPARRVPQDIAVQMGLREGFRTHNPTGFITAVH